MTDSTRTVLLVDDDAGVRKVTTLLLERRGWEVLTAADGRAGLEQLEAHRGRIDVVLLDVMMPVMTGHEAFPRIRERAPELPVVFCSGFDRSEVAEHLLDPTGRTSFLAKPFPPDDLYAALDEAVAGQPDHRRSARPR